MAKDDTFCLFSYKLTVGDLARRAIVSYYIEQIWTTGIEYHEFVWMLVRQYWIKKPNVAYTPDQLHQAILCHVKDDRTTHLVL